MRPDIDKSEEAIQRRHAEYKERIEVFYFDREPVSYEEYKAIENAYDAVHDELWSRIEGDHYDVEAWIEIQRHEHALAV